MKKYGRYTLITLNFLLLPIVSILGNTLAANFPAIPRPLLWIGGGGIIIGFTIVNVALALTETKQYEVPSQQSQHLDRQHRVYLTKPHPRSQNRPSTHREDDQQAFVNTTSVVPSSIHTASTTFPSGSALEEGQPTIERPMLLCLALDVSDSMKKPILDHTGKAIQRWASIQEAVEHFVQLGVAWVKDPETQRVLPLYHLMAYGFGFREAMYRLGVRKTPGGTIRDLLAHPSLPSLPSALELSEHWNDYKNHMLSMKAYTGDLFGGTPMCQALRLIRDRIKDVSANKAFTYPILLLIISDGLPEDGNPVPLIDELHAMNVMTLCCYLADQDVLAPRQLYAAEEAHWTEGARLLFCCASALHNDNYVSRAMFDYLADYGWNPREGVRLFAQVNQAEALGNFLEVLLQGSATERRT